MTAAERVGWERRFLVFGKLVLDELNNGKLAAQDASKYALQFYGAYLKRAKSDDQSLYALVSEGWMRAWHSFTGTYDGYLTDVERAWQRADRAFLSGSKGEALAQQIVALCADRA